MMTKIIVLAAISRYVLSVNVSIRTIDTGFRFSTNTHDIVRYYTPLSPFGIVPTAERSLKFYVKACAYAYLLFAVSEDITKAKDFYEIVIGGTRNTENKIRRRYKNGVNRNLKIISSNSLRCDKYMNFFINWSTDGNIKLGGKDPGEGDDITDSQPIQIHAFGIRTAWGHNGSWIFELKDNESMCHCPCGSMPKSEFWLKQNLTDLTQEELMKKLSPNIEAIKRELKINKYNLSINRRRRTSAPDDRKSAKSIGIVGTIVLCVVIGLIVLIDISALQRGVK